MIAEGDRVFVRATLTGTHRGELMGLQPSGKRVSMISWNLFRVARDKIAEHWGQADALGLLAQLGATPKQMADAIQPQT